MVARIHALHARWVVWGIVIGVASGLAAAAFFASLEWASWFTMHELARVAAPAPPGDVLFAGNPPPDGPPRRWLFFLLPALGGLAAGALVYRVAPEAEGPGTDEMIRAFHQGRGIVRARVAPVKALASIVTLATGGSAGKEGPVAQIGGGIGSVIAVALGLNARDRRILLLAGTAGGLGAIFRAPLGSAITAIEVLYREDFESDALIPCVISSVAAFTVFSLLIGGQRIFAVPELHPFRPIEIPGYLLLAIASLPVGRVYIWLFQRLRRLMPRLPGPRALQPMLGGLGVGLIGLFAPQVYGTGWGWLQQALDGRLGVLALAGIGVAKLVATCFTVGSGGSGGVFGPTLFIGGMLGGVIGYGGAALAPDFFPNPAAYVMVGMASFFAGVASAPIGALLMVTEMTGGYALLPPLMLVSVLAILFARGRSIYEQQVRDRFASPAHLGDLTLNVLEDLRVGDVFNRALNVTTVAPDTSFERVRNLVLAAREATLPVVDASGRLVGLLTAEQIRPVLDERQLDDFVVAGDIASPPMAVYEDDDLNRAHELFRVSGCPQLPVLEAQTDGATDAPRIIGTLDYRDVMRSYARELTRRREA